jgi:hypothetical protein
MVDGNGNEVDLITIPSVSSLLLGGVSTRVSWVIWSRMKKWERHERKGKGEGATKISQRWMRK